MPYDNELRQAQQTLWDENASAVTDQDIADAKEQVVSAALSHIGEELALKLRYNDGSETVHIVNPVAAKNTGLLLLQACDQFGWFNIDLRVPVRS